MLIRKQIDNIKSIYLVNQNSKILIGQSIVGGDINKKKMDILFENINKEKPNKFCNFDDLPIEFENSINKVISYMNKYLKDLID